MSAARERGSERERGDGGGSGEAVEDIRQWNVEEVGVEFIEAKCNLERRQHA